jgi:hypothetical protein
MIAPLPPQDKIAMRGQHVRDRVARGKIRLLRKLQPKAPLGAHQEGDRTALAQRLARAMRITLGVMKPLVVFQICTFCV